MPWERGYLQVYTGDGKGKTTAAFGLALRAAGAGRRVFIAQFAKQAPSGEEAVLGRLTNLIRVERYGLGGFIRGAPTPKEVEAAREGLSAVRRAISSGSYDLVILDEGNSAVHLGLFSVDEVLEAIGLAGGKVEIVVTGRNAHPRLLEKADLITDMREVRHYYAKGVKARKGIEM
jgi:cob(I)alamin adenosyltransferase